MKTIEELKKLLSINKSEICERYGVNKIGIFGSYVRGEQNSRSDIDILVEFKKGYKNFDNYMELKFYLEELLSKDIDLLIESAINKKLKPGILEEVVYA
ncbi:MAG: nucleotidyltransferase [Spirochaetes bacterium]|nr:MAG: nucleotidyltransferase [Spirochaetota bacterium]